MNLNLPPKCGRNNLTQSTDLRRRFAKARKRGSGAPASAETPKLVNRDLDPARLALLQANDQESRQGAQRKTAHDPENSIGIA
jgi:hypothetical protein